MVTRQRLLQRLTDVLARPEADTQEAIADAITSYRVAGAVFGRDDNGKCMTFQRAFIELFGVDLDGKEPKARKEKQA